MKFFSWNNDKNQRLKAQRNVSFEEVVFYIERGQLLDVIELPNQAKYRDQKIFILQIGDYAYLVPFVEAGDEVFLKTIIPSRKATIHYLRGKHG